MSRNRWASHDWAVAWSAFSLRCGGLGVQRDSWCIAPCCLWLCLPMMGLVNGLCYHIVAKNQVMQWSLQICIYVFAFRSDGEGRRRTSSTCSNDSLNVGGTPVTPRRISWRQRIFLRVASPMNKSASAMQQQGLYGAHEGITPHWCKLGNGMQWFVSKETYVLQWRNNFSFHIWYSG